MKQTGRMPDELDKVMSPPREFLYLWDWLLELECPVHFAELLYWQEVTGRRLALWEVKAMIQLDRIRAHG